MQLKDYIIEISIPNKENVLDIGLFYWRDIKNREIIQSYEQLINRMYGVYGERNFETIYRRVAVSNTKRMMLYEVHRNCDGMISCICIVLRLKVDGHITIEKPQFYFTTINELETVGPKGYVDMWDSFYKAKNMMDAEHEKLVKTINA